VFLVVIFIHLTKMPKQPKEPNARADPLAARVKKERKPKKSRAAESTTTDIVQTTPSGLPVIHKVKRVLTPEQREVLLGRLELARSARKAKLEAKSGMTSSQVTSSQVTSSQVTSQE
jgi:hypothetical protein